MLDTNMVFVQEQPKLLNRLCKMCDDQRTLPGTMVIPENALILPPEEERPRFEGGFGIVYKGTYRGRAIAIKSMKLYTTSNLDEYLSVGIPIRNSGLTLTQLFRGFAGRLLHGGIYDTRMFYRCSVQRWRLRMSGLGMR